MSMNSEGFTAAPLKCAKCQHGFIYYRIEELAAFLLEAAGNSLLLCLFLLPRPARVPQLVALLPLCHLGSPKNNLHQNAWRPERSECGWKGQQSYQVGIRGWGSVVRERRHRGKKGKRNARRAKRGSTQGKWTHAPGSHGIGQFCVIAGFFWEKSQLISPLLQECVYVRTRALSHV